MLKSAKRNHSGTTCRAAGVMNESQIKVLEYTREDIIDVGNHRDEIC